MNMQVTDWQAHYKAVKARICPALPPRVRMAAVCYDAPIGPPHLTPKQIIALEAMRTMTYAVTKNANRWRVLVEISGKLHGFNETELFSNRRAHNLCIARHELWWVAQKYLPWSLPQFGRLSGGRDHTTILHGVHSYDAKIKSGAVKSELLGMVKDAPLFSDEG
jgi:chromosomal replication initiator protein